MIFKIDTPDLTEERVGNAGTPGVWHFDSGKPGPSVLISALIHGNELCGAWVLKDMLAAGLRPRKGKLTLAFCNLAAFDRFDPLAHDASRFADEDLNRVWTEQKLAEPITRERQRALELLPWVKQADRLLDLHSMHEPSPPLWVTGILQRNIDLGLRLGVPRHLIVDAGHKDGTRMRDYGQFGDPDGKALALLVECGFHGDPSSLRIARQATAQFLLESAVVLPDQLPEEWQQRDGQDIAQQVLQVTQPVVAKTTNLTFSSAWRGMECIERAGTTIGMDDGVPIVTPYDNCVLVMPSLRQLVPGVTVLRFARQVH
ncbi:succinylglutamate desuccinylase [Pollutimonas nitritireducens]|uniref:Succinylglutamate desuccinylase n=1 Tax=Pollutimonas nitritireducens TaxID=2045209 RepID=A0A2N4UJM7_9BURK|nr:succinylglutamate desuccinylase/aspartoacylase family protein [Pollutimonas nitritireducens]PLC55208.1 succinylglutamate desuccinylase [Pollutimonas nitritireducens]